MILHADARQIPLVDGCVQCCVTSPPYFGLRDYGTANQIGLEPTPDAYVAQLVAVFREVRRVLAEDGVLWLNLGDSYATTSKSQTTPSARGGRFGDGGGVGRSVVPSEQITLRRPDGWDAGAKPKDLLGIPWRVAFALQADGWYLRSDVIWHKPNPMPESVTDRPTKSHEYLFLLAKSERYYYDADAIAEAATHAGKVVTLGEKSLSRGQATGANVRASGNGLADLVVVKATRNKRSVWTIPTMPYSGAHFATMPEALVEPCVLAGSRLGDRVLDPFMGSGTVGAVAERLGRRWVGLDLNPSYHQLARKRTSQRGLRFDVA